MPNNIPQTRAELLRNIQARIEWAKEEGSELIMLETWEAAWLFVPMLMSVEADADGTGEIVPLIPNNTHNVLTQRNTPIRITNAEHFIQSVGCDEATEEYAP